MNDKNVVRLALAFSVLAAMYNITVFSAVTYVVLHFVWKFW